MTYTSKFRPDPTDDTFQVLVNQVSLRNETSFSATLKHSFGKSFCFAGIVIFVPTSDALLSPSGQVEFNVSYYFNDIKIDTEKFYLNSSTGWKFIQDIHMGPSMSNFIKIECFATNFVTGLFTLYTTEYF